MPKYDKEDDDRFFDEINWADAAIIAGVILGFILLAKNLV